MLCRGEASGACSGQQCRGCYSRCGGTGNPGTSEGISGENGRRESDEQSGRFRTTFDRSRIQPPLDLHTTGDRSRCQPRDRSQQLLDDVIIGGTGPEDEGAVVFDFDPQTPVGAEVLGPRGGDLRFDENDRRTNRQRRDDLAAKRAAEAAAREVRTSQPDQEYFEFYDLDDEDGLHPDAPASSAATDQDVVADTADEVGDTEETDAR